MKRPEDKKMNVLFKHMYQNMAYRLVQGAHAGIIKSYFHFSIYNAIRKVLFLGILEQRSYKGLILNATEFFQILDKFSFREISKLSWISKLMHLNLKVHSGCLIIPCVQK